MAGFILTSHLGQLGGHTSFHKGARECVCFTRSLHLKMRDVDPSVRNLRGTCCQMGILDLSPDPLNWKLWEESLALAAQSRLALPQVAPPPST